MLVQLLGRGRSAKESVQYSHLLGFPLTQITTMVLITHPEPNILEYKVKWVLGSIAVNKASGGDGIPVELFQILKDDTVKVLHSIWQQVWKT